MTVLPIGQASAWSGLAMWLLFLVAMYVLIERPRVRRVLAAVILSVVIGSGAVYAQVVPNDCYWWFGVWCCPAFICG
jgi:hypothetical protein